MLRGALFNKWKLTGVLAVSTGAFVCIIAATSSAPPPISAVSDVVPSFSKSQSVNDKLPDSVLAAFATTGADLENSRFLGSGANLKYFAVAKDAGEICIVTVQIPAKPSGMGCTTLKGFETYGLRVANAEQTEQAWLVSPKGTDRALKTTGTQDSSGAGWQQVSSNLLILKPTSN